MSKPTFLGPLIGKGVGQCELVYAERGSVLAREVEPAFDSQTRKKGLLGRESIPPDYALVIAPCSAVHTFSMRMPIDMIFVTRNGTITKTCRAVKPWRMAASLGAYAVIEAAEGFIERHELVPGEAVALRETGRGGTEARESGTEAAPGATPPARARHTTTNKQATLAGVVSGRTPLAWFESVAIVQELCEAVLTRGPDDDLRIPELKHIALTADGRVALLAGGPSGHSPVQRTGLVLLALTPESQLPMQLRLLVLEEVSPRPRLQSLRELHRELEFFERPDRRSIVREVFERIRRDSSEGAAGPAVPPPLLEPPPPKRNRAWWKSRRFWAGAVGVLVTLAAAVIAWAWPRPEGRWLREGAGLVSRAASAGSERVVETGRRGLGEARDRLGRSVQPPRADIPVVALPPPSTSDPALGVSLQGGAPAPPSLPTGFAGLPRGTPVPAAEPATTAAQGAPASWEAGAIGPGGVVYSREDSPRVLPPRLISPRVPIVPPSGRAASVAPEVDVVVGSSGEVESVKLVGGQTTALSGMQISAVKAWRFQPASMDGQPVRYRLRVRLSEK